MRRILSLLLGVGLGLGAAVPSEADAAEVVVYSARKEELIRPALDAFQKDTGIKVTLLSGKAGDLARRIEVEKGDPKGDVFLGTTAGMAELLRRKGLLAPYFSASAQEVPEEFRAPDGGWVALGDAAVMLCGMERILYAQMDEKDFLRRLLDILLAWELRRTELLLAEGVDCRVHIAW